MLKKLSIHNYVFIQHLTIDFSEGYQVITGETGAGKSVILDAFALALGDRFDKTSVLNDTEKCLIEVEFDIQGNTLIHQLLEQMDLDVLPTLCLRRELNPSTLRTRSFINDTPATLDQIQHLAVHLVDLHRQFDHLHFFNPLFELETIDAMVGKPDIRASYHRQYKQLKKMQLQRTELSEKLRKHKEEQDYLQHIVSDIQEHHLEVGEMEALETEQKTLRQAEHIQQALYNVYQQVYEAEHAMLPVLSHLQKELAAVRALHPDLDNLSERFASLLFDLEDVAKGAFRLKEHFHSDEQRLQEVEERLSLLYTLFKKYKVNSIEAILSYVSDVQHKLDQLTAIEQELTTIEQTIITTEQSLEQLATQITAFRASVVQVLDEQMASLLPKVGMPNAQWKTEMQALSDFQPYGKDNIVFWVDINHIGTFSPVANVASGGEFSRIMLCLKHILAHHTNLSTLVFDEIDVGVSGETAKNIAELLRDLGKQKMVVCITHHPTVAALANYHFYVYKQREGQTTSTYVVRLSEERRIEVIAKMIDGDKPSAISVLHAKELMGIPTKNG